MVVDMHFHTNKFSKCSSIDPEEGIKISKERGLDGICITEHDQFFDRDLAFDLQNRYNILVIVGVEIQTFEGDILCFGLDKIPNKKVHAKDLVDYLHEKGGVSVAAHPYRLNNRGIGNYIKHLPKLNAVETLNGNTIKENNNEASISSKIYNKVMIGGSDAHSLLKIGSYATYFENKISSQNDLIEEIKKRKCEAVKLKKHYKR